MASFCSLIPNLGSISGALLKCHIFTCQIVVTWIPRCSAAGTLLALNHDARRHVGKNATSAGRASAEWARFQIIFQAMHKSSNPGTFVCSAHPLHFKGAGLYHIKAIIHVHRRKPPTVKYLFQSSKVSWPSTSSIFRRPFAIFLSRPLTRSVSCSTAFLNRLGSLQWSRSM